MTATKNDAANKPADASKNNGDNLAKARAARKKKAMSPVRKAAEDAYANAKSDQEKTAARSHLKIVRFKDIVIPRVKRAVKVLENVESMANRNAYTWTPEEAAKIVNALQAKVDSIAFKFSGTKASAEEFTL